MVVVTLTDVPAKLRGDLSKWMVEINTGVFVGNFNSRIREELWQRICDNLKTGKATMVFSARGEQGMDFLIHNPSRKVQDFDGIKLVKILKNNSSALPSGYSKASKIRKLRRITASKTKNNNAADSSFVIIDIETTGLNPERDAIIELSAIKVSDGKVLSDYSSPVRCSQRLGNAIIKLTGITDDFLAENGAPIIEVLSEFVDFIGDSRLVFHNAAFDLSFINSSLEKNGFPLLSNSYEDTMELAKSLLPDASGYKLSALADYFGFEEKQKHRAFDDCMLTLRLYECLNKLKAK